MALILLLASTCLAQDDGLWLARASAHEAGFTPTPDTAAIYQTLRVRARPAEPIRATLRRVMPRFARGTSARAWALTLERGSSGSPRRPSAWPLAWPWSARIRSLWGALLEHADRVVSGAEPPPCRGSPAHWLSRTVPADREARHRHVDLERAWVPLECGETRNEFFEVR